MMEFMWTERMRIKFSGKSSAKGGVGESNLRNSKEKKEEVIVDSDGDEVEIMDTKGSEVTRRSMRSMMSLRSCRSMKRKPNETMKMTYRNVN